MKDSDKRPDRTAVRYVKKWPVIYGRSELFDPSLPISVFLCVLCASVVRTAVET